MKIIRVISSDHEGHIISELKQCVSDSEFVDLGIMYLDRVVGEFRCYWAPGARRLSLFQKVREIYRCVGLILKAL